MDIKKANEMYKQLLDGKEIHISNLHLMAKAFYKASMDNTYSTITRKKFLARKIIVLDEIDNFYENKNSWIAYLHR